MQMPTLRPDAPMPRHGADGDPLRYIFRYSEACFNRADGTTRREPQAVRSLPRPQVVGWQYLGMEMPKEV